MNIEKERFEAWLMSQPGDRRFVYTNTNDCLICRFIKENTNCAIPSVGSDRYWIGEFMGHLPQWLQDCMIEGMLAAYSAGDIPGPSGLGYAHFKGAFRRLFPELDPIIEPSPQPSLCKSI